MRELNTIYETKKGDQLRIFKVNMKISFKSLFMSKKWMLLVIIGVLPLIFGAISDPLFGNEDAIRAFIDYFMGFSFFWMFGFTCLLISLPLSSDEISDHMIEYYLIRPTRRENLWTARWIVATVSIIAVNWLITTIQYLFFYILGKANPLDGLDYLFSAYWFIVIASFTYSGLFLLVGFMGSRGLTFGVILIVVESFFLSVLFLNESPMVPRPHLINIGFEFFHPYFREQGLPDTVTIMDSYSYLFSFGIIFYLLGMLYFRRKEFN